MPTLLLPLLVAAVLGAALTAHLQGRTGQRNLAKLATPLGLDVNAAPPLLGLIARTGTASGRHRGRTLRLHSFVTGLGKHRERWIAATLDCANPGGLEFQIAARSLVHRLGSLLGQEPLDTSDALFDTRLAINTSAPEFLRASLLPEMRASLLEAWATAGPGTRIDLDGDTIALKIPGSFASKRHCRNLETMLPALVRLAELPEAYAATR